MDEPKTILLNYRKNKKLIKEYPKDKLKKDIKEILTYKLDIDDKRIKNIIINENTFSVSFDSKQAGSNQLKVIHILEKLNNILNMSDIKIYDENKNNYYYTIYSFTILNKDTGNIILDNSIFENKYS
jgi:hypothetical protein